MLGLFVTMLSLPVLVGTLWAEKLSAQVVNAVAGLVLLAVGLVMAVFGASRRRKLR